MSFLQTQVQKYKNKNTQYQNEIGNIPEDIKIIKISLRKCYMHAMTINQEIQKKRIIFLAKCKFVKLTPGVEEHKHTKNHRSQEDC